MKAIGTRLRHDVDLAAAVIPILGVKLVGDNAKFRNRIEIGNDRGPVGLAFFHVRAVHHESIRGFALPVHC
jgi:hypothetical protein